jgi:hypothetical protein
MADAAERNQERSDPRRSNSKPENVATNPTNNKTLRRGAYPELQQIADRGKGDRLAVDMACSDEHRRRCK